MIPTTTKKMKLDFDVFLSFIINRRSNNTTPKPKETRSGTLINESIAHRYELKTNDYLIGLTYDLMIDSLTVVYGAIFTNYKKITVEAIIHPCRYEDGTVNHRFTEYLLTKNKKLKEKIEKMGFEITNYAEKES